MEEIHRDLEGKVEYLRELKHESEITSDESESAEEDESEMRENRWKWSKSHIVHDHSRLAYPLVPY